MRQKPKLQLQTSTTRRNEEKPTLRKIKRGVLPTHKADTQTLHLNFPQHTKPTNHSKISKCQFHHTNERISILKTKFAI